MRKALVSYYLLISLIIIAADQISKHLIIVNLAEDESVSIIGDLLHFRFIFNEGGAMGTSLGPSWVYTILTLVALFLIIRFFIVSKPDGVAMKLSLALILGGAVGNLIDRLRYGKVIDFIDVDFPDIPFLDLYRWYTFNIADSAITTGLILFGISLILHKNPTSDMESSTPDIGASIQTDPHGSRQDSATR